MSVRFRKVLLKGWIWTLWRVETYWEWLAYRWNFQWCVRWDYWGKKMAIKERRLNTKPWDHPTLRDWEDGGRASEGEASGGGRDCRSMLYYIKAKWHPTSFPSIFKNNISWAWLISYGLLLWICVLNSISEMQKFTQQAVIVYTGSFPPCIEGIEGTPSEPHFGLIVPPSKDCLK